VLIIRVRGQIADFEAEAGNGCRNLRPVLFEKSLALIFQ
jgi:hypothetical protein